MAKSSRYFQLTPDILLEYTYSGSNPSQKGNATEYIDLSDYETRSVLMQNKYNNKPYFYMANESDNFNSSSSFTNNSLGTLVLPVNQSQTKFVLPRNYNGNGNGLYYDFKSSYFPKNDIEFDDENKCDVVFDDCVLHFTSRNYMGSYDGLIINADVFNPDKSEISLASFIIKKTDDLKIEKTPLLINQKLYTTRVEFRIPSTDFLLNNEYGKTGLTKILSSTYKKLMDNTPIRFRIYGIKSTYESFNYTFYNTEEINEIQVPNRDSFSSLYVDIKEATDGDYFLLTPRVKTGTGNQSISFSDFLENLEDTDGYIVMHDISLTEYFVNNQNKLCSQQTHNEYYIVNVSEEKENSTSTATETQLNKSIAYRPVALYGSTDIKFTITDTLKLLNTNDNTTTVKQSSFDYYTPYKYGKQMNKIYLDEIPVQVNVYNKRMDRDLDAHNIEIVTPGSGSASSTGSAEYDSYGNKIIKIANSGANNGFSIENHQYAIRSFIECTNVGVSINQVSGNLLDPNSISTID